MAGPVKQLQKKRTEERIDQASADNNNLLVFYCAWLCRKMEKKGTAEA